MKNRFLAFTLSVFALFASACGEVENGNESGNISLEVSPQKVIFEADGGTATVTISTNGDSWDFTNATSWLEVAANGSELTLVAFGYDGKVNRSGEIVVVATKGSDFVKKSIIVEQVAAGGSSSEGDLNFECPVFKQMMLDYYDRNGDGVLSAEEAAVVTELSLTYDDAGTYDKITSLNGIKNFVNLVNLDCDLNAITNLDLSGMEKLEYVDCSNNLITEINLNNCPNLKQLYANVNRISLLHIENCKNFLILQAYQNKIRTIDVSNLPKLYYLDLRLNSLTEAKFSNCPELRVAALGDNELMSLELKGLPELYSLGCYSNNISSLDLSELPKLDMLECYDNNIATLDLSANPKLATLTCQNNLISELNIEGCSALKKLDCANNRLSGSLDTSAYPQLYILHCGGNDISELVIKDNTALTDVECANTKITSLDIAALTELVSLKANDCLLTELDASNNLKLATLYLQGNPLTKLVLAEEQKNTIGDLKLDNRDVIEYK